MEKTIPCPICGNDAISQYWGGEHGMEEAYTSCKICGYFDSFSYGAFEHLVNGKEWGWYYNTPQEEMKTILEEIKEETEKAKKLWSEK